MFCWETASEYEWSQIEAISIALSNHYNLLEFLFEKERPRLNRCPEELLQDARAFSSGEQVLIRVALDLWSSSGDARVCEILGILDQSNFENVLLALEYLGGIQHVESESLCANKKGTPL